MGLEEQERWKPVHGHPILIVLQGGSKSDLRGPIVREDADAVVLQSEGKETRVRKEMISKRVEEEMDPRDIWSAGQLVDHFKEAMSKETDEDGNKTVDLDNLNARQDFRIAEHAEKVGEFETARNHYMASLRDPEFLLANVAKQRLERVEAILRDAAALQSLREIRMALLQRAFRKVRERIEAFPEQHPDAGEAVKAQLERAKTLFGKKRNEYFQLEAKFNLYKILLNEIKVKVSEKDVGLSDVTGWTRSDLPELAFKLLGELFSKKDDVTPEEARAFWDARPKSSWRTANYGSGTFIVEPPKIKPPKKRRSSSKKKKTGGGAAAPVKIPKPPTRDQWWQRAGTKERQQWIMAFFAENSGLFEVAEEAKYKLCGQCNGIGLESERTQSGQTLTYLCTRCGGAQKDKRVKFR